MEEALHIILYRDAGVVLVPGCWISHLRFNQCRGVASSRLLDLTPEVQPM